MGFSFFNENLVLNFCLVLLRIAGFLFAWPLLGGFNVPISTKALFSLLFAIVLFPTLNNNLVISYQSWVEMFLASSAQVLVGLSMAFVCHLFFYIVNSGANLISISLGLSSAQIFNPVMGYSVTAFEHFYFIFAGLFFLTINGHHIFLQGLSNSFQIIPIEMYSFDFKRMMTFSLIAKDVLVIGLRLAGPVLVTILVMNITLGLVGRTVPQINVLVTSMPINILFGISLLAFSMPLIVSYYSDIFSDSVTILFRFIRGN